MSDQVAVVGCGYWGRNLVRNFAQLGALGYMCDASDAARGAQAALYPQSRVTSRFEEVLADNQVRAVALATPAAAHYAQAKAAILHGKDVFVEKPLALHYQEGQELVELAFSFAGLDWQEYVVVDPELKRPAEVDLLLGDASKARRQLGWAPEVQFPGLVRMMVNADLARLSGRAREGA